MAEHAGAAGPDPRELIAEAREAAEAYKTAERGFTAALLDSLADSLGVAIDRSEKAEEGQAEAIRALKEESQKLRQATDERDSLAGQVAELGQVVDNCGEVIAGLRVQVAALEAENARLYEGWPTSSGTGVLFLVGVRWYFKEFPTRANDGFATKRKAVQACLGLDAPAGGGE